MSETAINDRSAEAVIGRLHLERDLWRELAEARSGILVAYRTGGRPPGKHIDNARRAERLLSEMEAEWGAWPPLTNSLSETPAEGASNGSSGSTP